MSYISQDTYEIISLDLEKNLKPGELIDIDNHSFVDATVDRYYEDGTYDGRYKFDIKEKISDAKDIYEHSDEGSEQEKAYFEAYMYWENLLLDYVTKYNAAALSEENESSDVGTIPSEEAEEDDPFAGETADEKTKHRIEFRQKLLEMSQDDRNLFAKIMQYDVLIEIIDAMKNFKQTSADVWKATIQRLKNLKGLSGDSSNAFELILPLLLAAVGTFAGTMVAMKNAESALSEADDDLETNPLNELIVDETKNDDEMNDDAEANDKNKSDDKKTASKKSIVITYAKELSHGFSLEKTDSSVYADSSILENAKIISEIPGKCKLSMCDNEKELSVDVPSSQAERIVIEFETVPDLTISVGNEVNRNDVIGTIDNSKIISKDHFIVDGIESLYIIGTKIHDTEINVNIDSLQSSVNSDIDNISKTLETYNNVISYIKDYILFTKIPALANMTSGGNGGNIKMMPVSDMCARYREISNDIISRYNDEIKRISSADNVKQKTDSGNLLELRKELDAAKNLALSNIIYMYDNPNIVGGHSGGRVSDYCLLNEYLSVLTGDSFIYDELNPYVVRTYNAIISFISKRIRTESNFGAFLNLKEQFNELCNEYIKDKWYLKKDTYYDEMARTFKYDAYAEGNTIKDIIEYKDTGNKTTLYSKVLKYLENLFGYVDDSGMTTDKDLDISNLSDDERAAAESEEEKRRNEKLSTIQILKRISVIFCILHDISAELSGISESGNGPLLSDASINEVITARNSVGGYDYVMNYSGPVNDGNPYNEISNAYLVTLKMETDDEERQLDKIARDAIEWFTKNNPSIEDNSIFNSLITADWGSPDTIYSENEQSDYYYISAPTTEPQDDRVAKTFIDTAYGLGDYNYWLKYFGLATGLNAINPLFWSVGLYTPNPLYLPVIIIPIVAIEGTVTVVIGLGICGISIYPLILCVNMTNDTMSCLTIITQTIETITGIMKNVVANGLNQVIEMTTELEKQADEMIENAKKELKSLEQEEKQLDKNMPDDGKTERMLKREARKEKRKKKKDS